MQCLPERRVPGRPEVTGFIERTPGYVQINGHLWDHAQLLAITVMSALAAADAAECQRRLQLARRPAQLLATALSAPACGSSCPTPEKAPAPAPSRFDRLLARETEFYSDAGPLHGEDDPAAYEGYEARFND